MSCNQHRVEDVASVFTTVEIEGIEAFDEEEPEYDMLVTLAGRYDSDAHLALLSVFAGLSDFQLAIDAQAYWNSLEETVIEYGSLDSVQDVNSIMNEFLDEPVNARYTQMKRDRLVNLNENGFPEWFLDNYPVESPGDIWEQTAIDLGGRRKMSSKTVVLAMEILDIHNLMINGTYLDFPDDIDIPVDVHVKRMGRFAGITSSRDEDDIRKCWAQVADKMEE
jgi:N-glycosylase/DNA lyase